MGLLNGHAQPPDQPRDTALSSRRAFLGRAAGVSAGVIGLAAAATMAGTGAAAAAPAGAQADQTNWRFCQKCYSMFYWGHPTDGVCPSGGAHSAQGYNFVLSHT
jgi:hypothetical protein